MSTDIELRIIDPENDRYRLYGITECRTLFGEFWLLIAHGPVGKTLRRRTEVFADYTLLEERRKALIEAARRRGYAPVSSKGSPA